VYKKRPGKSTKGEKGKLSLRGARQPREKGGADKKRTVVGGERHFLGKRNVKAQVPGPGSKKKKKNKRGEGGGPPSASMAENEKVLARPEGRERILKPRLKLTLIQGNELPPLRTTGRVYLRERGKGGKKPE